MSPVASSALLGAWAEGRISLRDLLGVPAEAIAAAHRLGERCLVLGDLARAEAIFSGLSALEPADPRSAVVLATLALEQGAPDVALAWIERAQRLVPEEPALRALAERARRALARRAAGTVPRTEPYTASR